MAKPSLAIVVLAAGKGTRMRSSLPKVMHTLAGLPMLRHVLNTAEALSPDKIVVVIGPGMASVEEAAKPHATVIQQRQLGTGDAVSAALPELAMVDADDVLVLYGDTPLVGTELLKKLIDERRQHEAAVVVAGVRVALPSAFGRLVLDSDGNLDQIVEAKDATAGQLEIDLCNSGMMSLDGKVMASLLSRLTTNNASGEYYLTDAVALARKEGRVARVVIGDTDELVGVNSRAEQAVAEGILQRRLRANAMQNGATLIDPATVFLCADTKLGSDVLIGPFVSFGPGVTIEDNVVIKPYSHIEGAIVSTGAIIGPYARLRPGTKIGSGAHVGNFVELKNTILGAGAKANHLTYLGDADIGAGTNIGAGTITCNYDGFVKSRTTIGADAFISSHTTLIAPVIVGEGAMTAAGSVITENVTAGATAIARSRQIEKPGHALQFRERGRAKKSRNPAIPGKV